MQASIFTIIRKRLPTFVIGILFIFFAAIASAATGRLTGIHIVANPGQSHIVLDLTGETIYHVFTLANPDRLVVDLPATRLATPLHPSSLTNSAIIDMRSGYPVPGTLRIVFDLNKAHRPHVSLLHGANANHKHLIVDLYEPGYHPPKVAVAKKIPHIKTTHSNNTPSQITTALTEEQMLEQAVAAESQQSNNAVNSTLNKSVVVNAALTKVLRKKNNATQKFPNSPLISILAPPVNTLPTPARRAITVIIDPGHGGKDPGTTGHFGVREKDVVLAIGSDLYQQLQKDPRFHVVMTRGGDYFLTLRQRLSVARQNHGDIFIAIHADTFKDPYATGASIYALSAHGASSEAARWLAQKENYSELGGVTLRDKSDLLRSVLLDLSQTATISASMQLGNSMLQQLKLVGKLHNKIVEQAPFMVLKSPDIPSVLVETGFLSNTSEEERLRNPIYQEQIAEALYAGVVNYFVNNPLPGTLLASQVTDKVK